MLAAVNFWGTPAALALAIGLATAAAFLLGVMLFGTASRRRQQKIIGERMAAVGNRGRKVSHVTDRPHGRRLDPRACHQLRTSVRRCSRVQRAARCRARSRRRQPAFGRVRVVTVAAAFGGHDPRFVDPQQPLARARRRSVCGLGPTIVLKFTLKRREEKLREQLPGRAHDHGELAPSRTQLPPGARHDGQGDRAARRHRVPARRRRDPSGPKRRGRAGRARRAGRKRGLQVGRPRRQHPARGRRQPGRDPGQRCRHAARARHDAPAGPGADVRGPALRVGPRR